jgi:hypothetical protein
MQTNSIVSNIENQEWLTSKEMAARLNVATSTLSNWLTANTDLKEFFSQKKGRTLWLNKDLIPHYVSRKGLRDLNIPKAESLKNAKMKMVEMASDNHLAMQELMSDPIIKLRLQQIESEKRLRKLEEEQAELIKVRDDAKAALLSLPPATVEVTEPSNRANLVRLVREYERATNLDYSYGWGPIYKYMYDTFSVNVKKRAEKSNKSKLDIIEESGHLDSVYAWAKKKFNL